MPIQVNNKCTVLGAPLSSLCGNDRRVSSMEANGMIRDSFQRQRCPNLVDSGSMKATAGLVTMKHCFYRTRETAS